MKKLLLKVEDGDYINIEQICRIKQITDDVISVCMADGTKMKISMSIEAFMEKLQPAKKGLKK